MTWKPPAPKGMRCPLERKDVSRVCHYCAWYTEIKGTHPQTGAPIEQWMCAQTAVVLTTLEAAKAANEGGAVTQELRNDMQRERQAQTRLLLSRPLPQRPALHSPSEPRQIEHVDSKASD